LPDDIILQPDGKILASGIFQRYNGVTASPLYYGIIRINSDGSQDTSFDSGDGFDDEVSSIALLSNGNVIIGGWFTEFAGVSINRISLLEAYTAPVATPTSNPHPRRTFSPVYSQGSYIPQVATTSVIANSNIAIPTTTISVTIPKLNIVSKPTFTKDLLTGVVDPEVKLLQQYLNTHGFTVAMSGPGSIGNETTMFGALTRAALAKFQKANSISPAAGYFGKLTRAFVNSH
jgi:hypothetical protein